MDEALDQISKGLIILGEDRVILHANKNAERLLAANAESVVGSRGRTTVSDTAGPNSFTGQGSADTFASSAGIDVFAGGLGNDTLDLSSRGAGVTVRLTSGFVRGGGSDIITLSGVENVTGTAFDDHIIGTSGANIRRQHPARR